MRTLIIVIMMVLLIGGCASKRPTFYMNSETDLSFINRVAVFPFENLTSDRNAGEIIRQLVTSELLATGFVDVAVPGEVRNIASDMGLKTYTSLSAEEIKEIGKKMKVQAVVLGTVEKFGETRLGNASAPEVTITVFMAETNGGSIIWSVTKSHLGASFLARHFGARAETLTEAAMAVAREAVHTLYEY